MRPAFHSNKHKRLPTTTFNGRSEFFPGTILNDLPSALLLCILLILIPLVYHRAFLRCHLTIPEIDFQPSNLRLISDKNHGTGQEKNELITEDTSSEHGNTSPPSTQGEVLRQLNRDNRTMLDLGFPRTRCISETGTAVNHVCVPSVIIAGYEKCGTSALYFKLAKHPEIDAHPSRKEFCPTGDSPESVWDWIEDTNMPRIESAHRNNLLLNGCIGMVSKLDALKELLRISPNVKVLVSLRNYADWAYSYYSYRCVPGYDSGCNKLKSVNEKGPWKNTRTPANFDDIAQHVFKEGHAPHAAFGIIRPVVSLYRPWLEKLLSVVRFENLMIVQQEELSLHPKETLGRVADFLGVKKSSFPNSAFTLVSNTNANPSGLSSLNESSSESEVSAIVNSGSVIFDGTRSLLNGFWKQECKWLRITFGIHFKDAC